MLGRWTFDWDIAILATLDISDVTFFTIGTKKHGHI